MPTSDAPKAIRRLREQGPGSATHTEQAVFPGSHTRSSCNSSTSISSMGCGWGPAGEPCHGWTLRGACPPLLALCAGEDGAASAFRPEPTRHTGLLQPYTHDSLAPKYLGSLSNSSPACPPHCLGRGEEGVAYLLLSLIRGGHGWVEGPAQAPWCQLQDPHHSLGVWGEEPRFCLSIWLTPMQGVLRGQLHL